MVEKKKTATAATAAKATKARKTVKKAPRHIGIVAADPWLEPYEAAICGRHDHALWMMTLSEFANGH